MEVVYSKTLKSFVFPLNLGVKITYYASTKAYSAGFMDHKIIKHQSKRRIPSE